MNAKIETPECLTINPEAGIGEMHDAIIKRLSQAGAITTALSIESNDNLAHWVVGDCLWAVHSLIEEAKALQEVLWERVREEGGP